MVDTPEPAYGADQIQVLEGLEAVRRRPGMYIGSTGSRGLHHLVYELVDNSVDEALAGYCTKINVAILADGGVRVTDNGRGIPVDIHPKEGVSTVQVVLTTLHAGGKFGSGGYSVSGGLHGVGSSVVNALSKRLHVEVSRQGFVFRQNYEGGNPTAALERCEETNATGTAITFWPDDDIFETVCFEYEVLRSRLQQMAFLNSGLTVSITDERVDSPTKSETYCYQNGLFDYVMYQNRIRKHEPLHEEIIHFQAENKDRLMSLEVAMRWTSSSTENIYTFANTINTHEGGTHEEGFRAALTSLVNRYAREKGFLKEKDESLQGEDVREGLTAIISVKLGEPQFEGQTKTKLGNTEMRGYVHHEVNSYLWDWFDSHPAQAKVIISKALLAAEARLAAKRAREASRKRGLFESVSMPGKLKECQAKDPAVSELFIVEGDSAGGSAIQGRDPLTQAVLPLRGKILNVEKARLDKAIANSEIQAMLTAFGSGIAEDFDESKARYHKIILMSDADVDGQHITTLLLTLLFRYMRPLIESGYVYLAHPPLYRIKWSNSEHDYVFSDRERDKKLAEGKLSGKKIPKENAIQRYKGLGEMNYRELWDTTMNPATRTLRQITVDDVTLADEIFSVLMGEDVDSRRKFIQHNARDVRFLDI